MPPLRRTATLLAAAIITATTLTSCGARPASDSEETSSESTLPVAEGTTQYPLDLVTDYGTTTLKKRPERIVVVGGLQDLETVLALGAVPVMANKPTEWPWNVDAGGDQVERSIDIWSDDGLPFEEILSVKPDVIIAGTYGKLGTDYAKLADIAPVVAMESYAEAEASEVDWKDLMRTVAPALDLAEAGDQVIAETDAMIADTAAAHPEWKGTTTSFVINRGEQAGIEVINIAGSPAERLFTEFGFAHQPQAATLAATEGAISSEQLGLLDADTLVVAQHGGNGSPADAKAWLESSQLYQSLPAVRDGRVGIIQPDSNGNLPIAWAFAYPNALSIRYIADQISSVYGEIIKP